MAKVDEDPKTNTMSWGFICLMVTVYVGYIFIGAVLFMAIEQQAHSVSKFMLGIDNDHEAVKRMKEDFLRNHTNVDEHELERLVQAIYAATKMNIDPRGNTTPSYNWNGFSAVIFTTSVVTTIGFGNVTPQSTLGQIVCILYAVIGIPLNFTLLGRVGEKLQMGYIKIAERLSQTQRMRKRLRCCVGIMLGAALSIFLPAIFYCWFENWSYVQSVYFCFITISTIGFGDFYPTSDTPRRGSAYYFLFLSSILWGMVWISTAFSIVQSITCNRRNCRSSSYESDDRENHGVATKDESVALREENFRSSSTISQPQHLPALENKNTHETTCVDEFSKVS